MKYHVKLKKNLEKRGACHLGKRRVCQEDPNNKKIEVCDKIMSSFKVTQLFLSLLYSYKNLHLVRFHANMYALLDRSQKR